MDRRVNILYLIDILYDNAGSEVNLYRLVSHLDKSRFNPVVCPLTPTDSPMIRRLREQGITVEPLPLSRIYDFNALRQGFCLRRLIKRHRIDVVQTIHFSSDVYGTLVSRLSGVPIVISSRRDMGLAEVDLRHRFARRIANRFVTMTTANSYALRREICRRERIPFRKAITIHNGVDLNDYRDSVDRFSLLRRLGLLSEKKVVGCIANIRPVKGLEYFLQAAVMVGTARSDVQFVIVGGDADCTSSSVLQEYKQRLALIIKRSGVEQRIFFLGRRSDVPQILCLMDIFVLPSLSEGFSNALLEAMAAGKPVVATDVGGNGEAIVDGETGFLVPPRAPARIAEAVIRLLNDRDLASRMGGAGRSRIQDVFTVEAMVNNYGSLYTQLLSKFTRRKRDAGNLGSRLSVPQ